MKVKIKQEREESRIQAKVGTGYIKITKLWRPVTLNQFVELFEKNREVLDFYSPESEQLSKLNLKEKTDEVKEVEKPDEVSIEESDSKKVMLTKDDIKKLSGCSKDDIEQFARDEFGIELDKRKSTSNMIKELKHKLKRL